MIATGNRRDPAPTTSARAAQPGRCWAGAVLALLVTALAVGLAEGMARLFWPEYTVSPVQMLASSRYHHVMPANLRMYAGRIHGKQVFIRTNEDGFRTGYSRRTFRQHDLRVAVFGDSFAYGHGLAEERMFASLLEQKLRAQGVDAAVLNAAEKGYSPLLERRRYEGLAGAYAPNIVLLLLDATDIGDDLKYESELTTKPRGERVFPYGDDRPHFARGFLGSSWERLRQRLTPALRRWWGGAGRYDYYQFQVTVDGRVETNRFFIYRHPLAATRPHFDRTMSHVNATAAACAAQGAEFYLFVTPRFQHWNTNECPRNWEAGDYALKEPYQYEYFRYFEEQQATAGYAIVNMLPMFQKAGRTPLVFDDDPHWNEAGSDFAAGAVAAYLQSHAARLAGGSAARQAGVAGQLRGGRGSPESRPPSATPALAADLEGERCYSAKSAKAAFATKHEPREPRLPEKDHPVTDPLQAGGAP